MTTDSPYTPTRVVQYAYATGRPQVAAVFRWNPAAGVTLAVVDPEWGQLAREHYQRGAPSRAEQRAVPRSEGAAFMRALVEPQQSAYTRFVDESRMPATVDRQQARAIAQRMLDEEVREPDAPEIVLVDEGTKESETTWAFVYNTRAWLETGDDLDILLGNSPIFIDKATGAAWFGRTDIDIEPQL